LTLLFPEQKPSKHPKKKVKTRKNFYKNKNNTTINQSQQIKNRVWGRREIRLGIKTKKEK
jgi:hypothetical protein